MPRHQFFLWGAERKRVYVFWWGRGRGGEGLGEERDLGDLGVRWGELRDCKYAA